MKLKELQARYPDDERFSVLDVRDQIKRAPALLKILGGVSSKWYLLFAPFGFALVWVMILVVTA